MHYVYVIQSKDDKKLYVGCTANLRKRIEMHNSGKVNSTRSRKPFNLLYYEAYTNKGDAFEREKYMKTGWGRNYIKKVLRNSLRS